MNPGGIQYQFTSIPWKYDGPNGWIFISLPVDMSAEIRAFSKSEEEGWGRLKAIVRIGNYEWNTAIWFDTKQNTYLLPLKAEVRAREKISVGVEIEVFVFL